MDLKKLADKAKAVVDGRGGPQSVKEDAQELRDIAQGGGTTAEKLRAAARALKEPGAHEDRAGDEPAQAEDPSQPLPPGS